MNESQPSETSPTAPAVQNSQQDESKWQPIGPPLRRVLGTLMEKAKTTPDAYPMSFTGLTTACNQKSNRSPVTNYSQSQVESFVEQLRELGAAAIVHGNGRVEKVRHYAYQWLGISGAEGAIMTELLLRGEQTLGELRTRASRMEPIADLGALQTLLKGLEERRLIQFLTPAGRGQMVSHGLYPDDELVHVKKVAERAASRSDSADISQTTRSHAVGQGASPSTSKLESRVAELESKIANYEERLAALESARSSQ